MSSDGSTSTTDDEEPPAFESLGRLGSVSGGRAETGSLDKTPSSDGPSFSSVKRNGVCTVHNPLIVKPGSAASSSADHGPLFGPKARPSGLSSVRVPDALKELEFDGAMGGKDLKGKDPLKDSVCRVGPLMKSLGTVPNEEKAVLLFELQQLIPLLQRAQFSVSTLIPQLCKSIVKWPHFLLEEAGDTLLLILKYPLSPPLLRVVCQASFEVIAQKNIPISFFETWGNVLVAALPKVTWEKAELENMLSALNGKVGDHRTLARKLTARLLGFFVANEDVVKKSILPRAVVLAEDNDRVIRGMIAESAQNIGAVLSISVVENDLWPTLAKFVKDEDPEVMCAAVRSIARIAMEHKDKSPFAPFFSSLLPDLFVQICTTARTFAQQDLRYLEDQNYLSLEITALTFGPLLLTCFDFLPANESRKDVFKTFLGMCTSNSPVIRRNCAYNLPGVASKLVSKYRGELSAIVEFLSKDADAESRWNLAAGIHEAIKILASRETVNVLYIAVRTLLQDSNALVRLNTLQHFNEIVSQLALHRGYAGAARMSPLFENLHLQCQGNWRTQELLARQLGLAAPVVPPPTIETNILPLLCKLAAQSAFQVRKASMLAVAPCIRHLSDTGGRETAMNAFREQWARSPVYWMRMGFIDAAEAAFGSYSRILFRDTFAAALLRFAHDPISNVRLRLAKVLEVVAPATHQMEEFHTALSTLTEDTDADVRELMKDISNRVEHVLETAKEQFEDDLDREEEEQNMYEQHLEAQRYVNKQKKTVKGTASVVLEKAKNIGNSQRRSPTQGADGSSGGTSAPSGNTGTGLARDGSVVLKKNEGVSPGSMKDGGSTVGAPVKENRGFRSRQKKKIVNFVSPKKTKQ